VFISSPREEIVYVGLKSLLFFLIIDPLLKLSMTFSILSRNLKQIIELDRKIGQLFCTTGTSASKCAELHGDEKVTTAARMREVLPNNPNNPDGREIINGYFD
jgi:hypothetical protein